MAKIAPYVIWQALDDNGHPLSGGKVYTYSAGTTAPKPTYIDKQESALNTNPVILDAAGRASIWLEAGAYKFRVTDADEALVKIIDDITGDALAAFGSGTEIVSANRGITSSDQGILLVARESLSLSLDRLEALGSGFVFTVMNDGIGQVIIDPNGTELINDIPALILSAGESAIMIAGDEGWRAIQMAYSDTVKALAGLQAESGKLPYFTGEDSAALLTFLDEDDMASDSDQALASQQSIKAYIEGRISNLPAPVISEEFIASDIPISNGTDITLVHGLSGAPTLTCVELVCQSPQLGYSAGDRVSLHQGIFTRSNSADYGIATAVSDTEIDVIMAGNGIALPNRLVSGNRYAVINNAQWHLEIRAYR